MGMISGSQNYIDTLTMADAETFSKQTLERDLNYARSQLKVITGETKWYDTPSIALTGAPTATGLSGSLQNIYDFVGMDDESDATPTYSSNNYVSNSGSLETAIGDLDAQAASNAALTLDEVCNNGSTTGQSITVAGLNAGSGLIHSSFKISGNEINGDSLDISGSGDIDGDLNVQGTVTVNTITLVQYDIHTTGELGISGSSVLGDDEDNDTTTIVGDLRLHNRLFVNYNGTAPGDDYIYFYSGSSVDGAHLMWDDSANAFEFNKTLSMSGSKITGVADPTAAQDVATKAYIDNAAGAGATTTLDTVCDNGNTTDQDIKAQNLYINHDGADADSYLYFYESGSSTGAYLKWDDVLDAFTFSHELDMSGSKITGVADPTAAQDAATKAYIDNAAGAGTTATLGTVCDNGAETNVAIDITASGSSFNSILDTGDLNVLGDILVGGTVDGVDIAGFASAVQTFVGMDNASDIIHDYTSTIHISNSGSLETAIGTIDSAIGTVDVIKEVERLPDQVFSGSVSGSHTIPGSHGHQAASGSTMDVFFNGILMQANTATEMRDYVEDGEDGIIFTFDVPENSYLTYIIRE